MRRTVLSALITFSVTALSIAITACATAPNVDEDFPSNVQEQKATDPTDETASAKLPPQSSPPAEQKDPEAKDAGPSSPVKADSGTPDTGSPSTVDSGPPATSGGDCDANDPTYYIKFIAAGSPASCPCSASECCYLGLACLAK